MLLHFDDFAHHYDDDPASETGRRENFAAFADFIEAFARAVWRDATLAKSLGIDSQILPLRPATQAESKEALRVAFNLAVGDHAAKEDRA